MPSVSHSEVESYLLCRRKHFYGYGLSLKRADEPQALAMGSAGHAVLEAYYSTILAAGGTWKEQKAAMPQALDVAMSKFNELVAANKVPEPTSTKLDLKSILFEYYFQNEPLVSNGWIIQAVEMEFNLQYDDENELRFPFVVDVIALDPNGKTVVVDHKFLYDFYTPEQTALQPQIPKYIGALRALNYTVHYGLYNMIRTRKQKIMTKETQLRTLDLSPNGPRVVETFTEQIEASEEIQALKQLPLEVQSRKAYRVANKMVCSSCAFKDLCELELIGGNSKLLIQTEYVVRERREFAEVSEDA